MLAIKGLKVVRGSFMVYLPHLTINDGECVALCGVSGSGKSTLLEAIGLLTPCLSVEHFSLNGINVDELDPHDAQALRVCDIGIMPQSGGLVPYLTIRENLQLQITLALKQQVYPLFPEHVDAAPTAAAATAASDSDAAADPDTTAASNTPDSFRTALELPPADMVTPQSLISSSPESSSADAACAASATPWQENFMVGSSHGHITTASELALSSNALETPEGSVISMPALTTSNLRITNEFNKAKVAAYMSHLLPLCKTLHLENELDKLPSALSIGQRQRALFLRAIAHKPRLILIDEPTASLDPDNARSLFAAIDEIAAAAQVCVLLVTHDVRAAARYRRYVYNQQLSYSEHSIFSLAPEDSFAEMERCFTKEDLLQEWKMDYPASSSMTTDFAGHGSLFTYNGCKVSALLHTALDSHSSRATGAHIPQRPFSQRGQ